LLIAGFAGVSMNDLLITLEIIVKRVEAAVEGDYVIVIYNTSSKKRIHQLQDTRKIWLKYRSPTTRVAILKGAFRASQTIVLTDLDNLQNHAEQLAMTRTAIVANSSIYRYQTLISNHCAYSSK